MVYFPYTTISPPKIDLWSRNQLHEPQDGRFMSFWKRRINTNQEHLSLKLYTLSTKKCHLDGFAHGLKGNDIYFLLHQQQFCALHVTRSWHPSQDGAWSYHSVAGRMWTWTPGYCAFIGRTWRRQGTHRTSTLGVGGDRLFWLLGWLDWFSRLGS